MDSVHSARWRVFADISVDMERTAFTLLHESEHSWWYRGRAAIVRNILEKTLPKNHLSILDFGAGYGGMHDTLALYGTVSAYEPDAEACTSARARGYEAVYDSVDTAFARPYDIVALFDVLEHIEDDAGFLQRARGVLKEKGRLLITVPAMPFLWSAHDVTHHHFRRYSREELRTVLEDAGYAIERMSYWNMFLFPPALCARLLGKSGESSFHLPRPLDTFFFTLICIEAFFIRSFSLPFGVSLVALVRKK